MLIMTFTSDMHWKDLFSTCAVPHSMSVYSNTIDKILHLELQCIHDVHLTRGENKVSWVDNFVEFHF